MEDHTVLYIDPEMRWVDPHIPISPVQMYAMRFEQRSGTDT